MPRLIQALQGTLGTPLLRAAVAIWLLTTTASVWAQEVAEYGAAAPPEERGFTVQYVLVFVLMALSVAAVCKPSFRQGKEET